jgi:hypothetical protein
MALPRFQFHQQQFNISKIWQRNLQEKRLLVSFKRFGMVAILTQNLSTLTLQQKVLLHVTNMEIS